MAEKLLIVAPSWIGDTVMMQPLLSALRAQQPQARIDVFAPQWSMAVLHKMTEVDQVLENPFLHGQLQLAKRYNVGKSLRPTGYQQAFILPGSLKSALVPLFARIPIRTGFVGESRYGLINDIRRLDKHQYPRLIDQWVSLAYPQGKAPTQATRLPVLSVNLDAAKHMATTRFSLENTANIAAICPGAEYGPAKRWPTHHFAKLVRELDNAGLNVVYFGSAKDATIAEDIKQQADGMGMNLCGQTTLNDAIDLLALSQIVICNDSGLMHVAAALNRPVVALYGSSSPAYTPPLTTKAAILSLNLPCSPCFKRHCPLQHTRCLEDLSAQYVFDETMALINKFNQPCRKALQAQ